MFIKCGLSDEEVIHAHGRLGNAVCAVCGIKHSTEKMKENFIKGEVYWCECEDGKKGPIKPNVVWFNEQMPKEFYDGAQALSNVDLLLIMGTTLKVKPFSLLPRKVPITTP